MNKEPNKSEPNEEAKVLSDEELEGIVGGGSDLGITEKASATVKFNFKGAASESEIIALAEVKYN